MASSARCAASTTSPPASRSCGSASGLAFYLGKALIQPQAPQIPSIALGGWSDSASVAAALQDQPAVPDRRAAGGRDDLGLCQHTLGLLVRLAGDSADAARALGTSVTGVRIAATAAGGAIAGLGGASLSLYYPGSWNEGLSSGQGLIAVALVIFARWHPAALPRRRAAVRRRRRARPGAAVDRRISAAITCSTPCRIVLTLLILVATCSPRVGKGRRWSWR